MKHLVFILSICVLSAAVSLPAYAEKKKQEEAPDAYHFQKMNYDVYAGGIHAVKADMKLDFREKGRYLMEFSAETRGLLGSLAPWKGSFKSQGWALRGGKRVPELHESVAAWRDEHEVKSYNYTKDGGFQDLVTSYEGKKPKTKIPDEELTKGTTDALTATLLVMEHVSDGGDCAGEAEVFDGKRRYKLIFRHSRFVMLDKSKYNAYKGPAAECTAEVVPIAGAWYKKPRGWLSIQEQGRDLGTMPTIWFAQVKKNAVVVPVRVRVKTTYGTLFMHMTRYESGKTLLKVK
ncbi:MAG: DUF3108 domain-containing protein [Alphaproteobacteria bacterium]